jgi:tetratricopeptide (TPR) repeat protein
MKRIALFTPAALSLLALWLPALAMGEEDWVRVRPAQRQLPPVERRGVVEEYNGSGLTLRQGTSKVTIPLDQLLEVHYTKIPAETTADAARAAGDLKLALTSYEQARDAEQRPWARRLVQVKLAACYEWNDDLPRAGDEILALLEEDPASPHFYALPLAWQNRPSHEPLVTKARRWMADGKRPAAMLLGASWLLTSTERARALEVLADLSSDIDPRIAPLALAQQWRVQVVTATNTDLERWEEITRRLPAELQGGPLLLIGQAQLRQKNTSAALLALLQPALLKPQREAVIAEATLTALNVLQQERRYDDALRVGRAWQREQPIAARLLRIAERLAMLEKQRSGGP